MPIGLDRLLKEIQFQSPLRRYFFPRYLYNFTPPQLCFLCQCLENTRDVPGNIAEVGCASGSTTVFLNKCMEAHGFEKTYYAVDTFSGFVPEDVNVEVSERGQSRQARWWIENSFAVNKQKWFDWTMLQNAITRVKSIEADVNQYDLRTLGPLSFCLLDVDLYRPIRKSLKELYDVLSPGGIMVVDDCDESNRVWDGADQAYKEFMKDAGRPIEIRHGKLGLIRK
jgi:O-methyltransferase